MKIYFIGQRVVKIRSGGDRYIAEVLSYLEEKVELIYLDFYLYDWAKMAVPFDFNFNSFYAAFKANLWAVKELRHLEHSSIVLMNPYNKGHFFIFPWIARYLKNCKIVTVGNVLRQYSRRNAFLNFIEKCLMIIFFTPAWIIIANSEMTKYELSHLGINEEKIKIVYPRVILPSEIKEDVYKDNDRFNIIFVGEFCPYKELYILILALSRLKHLNIHLHMVGEKSDPEYFSRLMKTVSKFGIENKITFYGCLEGEELTRQYKKADILVNPCRAEGYGRVFIEAMHFGLPVIGANQGGAKEIVKNGINGFLFKPANSEDLSEKIKILYSDKILREKMSLNAVEASRKANFTEDIGKQVLEIINTKLGFI
jgi:glycosyltransferase involved in cell wall biosynthesis